LLIVTVKHAKTCSNNPGQQGSQHSHMLSTLCACQHTCGCPDLSPAGVHHQHAWVPGAEVLGMWCLLCTCSLVCVRSAEVDRQLSVSPSRWCCLGVCTYTQCQHMWAVQNVQTCILCHNQLSTPCHTQACLALLLTLLPCRSPTVQSTLTLQSCLLR
jgi:hypothetical protein